MTLRRAAYVFGWWRLPEIIIWRIGCALIALLDTPWFEQERRDHRAWCRSQSRMWAVHERKSRTHRQVRALRRMKRL